MIILVDGRGFSRFTKARYQKPFDPAFHALMVQTAAALLKELHGLYAFTESDEISVLFRPDWDLFDREVEKLVSLSAAVASATLKKLGGIYRTCRMLYVKAHGYHGCLANLSSHGVSVRCKLSMLSDIQRPMSDNLSGVSSILAVVG